MGFAIAGAVIGALGSAGQAYLNWDATDSALDSMETALKKQKSIDIDEMKRLASETDMARFREMLQFQGEADPQFAQLRNKGAAGLLRVLMQDATGQHLSDTAIKQMGEDLAGERESTQRLIDVLIERAEADLAAGATLPPEFQAELIQAGLERAGGRGESIEGRGAAGTEIRRLLGREGLALRGAREASALQSVSAAEALRARRASVLQDLAVLDNNLRGAKAIRAGGAVTVGSQAMPAIGLTGADAVNLSLQNLNQENQNRLALGNIYAQKRLAEGAMYSGLLGSGTSAITSILGGMGGGGGGGGINLGAGAQVSPDSAGGGSWIGGLLNRGSTSVVPQSYTTNQYGQYGVNAAGQFVLHRTPEQQAAWNVNPYY